MVRKIVAGLFVSLDGIAGSPDQWQLPYFNDEMGAAVGGLMAAGDTLLLGRRTYQEFETAFAQQTEDPTAAIMNNTPKVVVSTTLDNATWQNSTLLSGDVMEGIRRLKEQPGGQINMSGSMTLVRSLLQAGLLDELHLLVHPVLVGNGKRLFAEGERAHLRLVESRTFGNGVLYLIYRPADAPSA